MKVLHIAEAFGGGIVEFVYQLILNMPDEKHILIYCEREIEIESIKRKFPANVEFIEWKFAQREINIMEDIKSYFYLKQLLKNLTFDIVHLHSSKAGFLGRIATNTLRIRNVVYTPNGASFLRKDISILKRSVFAFLEWVAFNVNGLVVCSSLSESKAYKKIFVRSTYVNNGITLPNNIDNNPPTGTTSNLLICTSGRICFQKNPRLFNKIAKSFENNDNIRFIWIGDGELKYELTSKNIEITGWLSKGEVLQKVKLSSLYISTALWEGLPFAVLEAMSLSKPLLLNSCVGNIDLVKNNINGYVFNSQVEAISYINVLLKDREKLQKFGHQSKQFFTEEFTAEKMVNSYLKIYRTVIRRQKNRV